MSATLSDEEIALERNNVPVKPHIVAQNLDFPLLALSNRQFELLAHALLQANAHSSADYDHASILPAGADRGRDILFLKSGVVIGLAQCKRYNRPLGADQVLIELLKFALFAVKDSALVPFASQPFKYQLWTASGVGDKARELFDSAKLFREALRDGATTYANKARGSLVGLARPKDENAAVAELNAAIEIASRFNLSHIGPEDIGPKLAGNSQVRRWFFRSPEDGLIRAQASEIDSLVEAFRQDSLNEFNSKGISGGIPYVTRTGMADAFEEFLASEARLFVLVGGSGHGKTSWAAQLLEYPPVGWSVDVIKAEEISADDDVATQTIVRSLRSRRLDGVPTYDFSKAVWEWLDAGNRILVVDGLDRTRSTVRETIAGWLRTTVALTRRASLRIVVTSRREAWSNLFSQLEDLHITIYRPDEVDRGAQASFALGNLDEDEAKKLYKAYGVSAQAHRGKRLTTPGLIARFSKLTTQARDSIITRSDVLLADVGELRNELRSKPRVGIVGSERLINRLGQTLLEANDGHVPFDLIVDGPASEAALEALLEGDRAVARDGLVRLESDETAELLMGENLDVDTAISRLAVRRDPLFVGAIAMMMAKIEREAPNDVGEALDRFLKEAPKGFSPQLDAISRSILELRNPIRVRKQIVAAVALWNQPNVLLGATNLAALVDEVALPASERFSLMRPLVSGEDTDDWRDKYWLDPDLPGRWKTSFADAAIRAVVEDPESLIPVLLTMITENDDKNRVIATGLLREAAVVSPLFSLQKAWSVLLNGDASAFSVVVSSAPAAASRFLTTVSLDTIHVRRVVVHFLRRIAHSGGFRQAPSPDVRTAVLAAADELKKRINDVALKAKIIIVRLLLESDTQLKQELVDLWSNVDFEDYWFGIEAVGTERVNLLAKLLEGRDSERNARDLISNMYFPVFSDTDLEAVVPLLASFAKRNVENSRSVARAIEVMLYASESTEGNSALWDLAAELAKAVDDETRLQLIFYAGSLCRHSVDSLEVGRRSNLLGILIESENGPNVGVLVWKLIESANERQNATQNLVRLSARLGRAQIESAVDQYDFLDGAKAVRMAFLRAFN